MSENDDPIAALIRAAGRRPQPDPGAAARVRAAVEGEWRSTVRARRMTRWSAAAVTVAAALALVFVLLPQRPSQPRGEIIETAGAARSVDWNGNTLRLDANSRVILLGADRARLERGRLYFSSERSGTSVAIATPFGEVHDVGTQFEMRLEPSELRVRVREGRIELRGHLATAGETLVATPDQVTLGRDVEDWTWMERAAPPIRLEGMTLDAVVQRVAREKGLSPEWRGADSKRSVLLRGEIAFTPDEALEAATAATEVTWRVDGRRLVIEARP